MLVFSDEIFRAQRYGGISRYFEVIIGLALSNYGKIKFDSVSKVIKNRINLDSVLTIFRQDSKLDKIRFEFVKTCINANKDNIIHLTYYNNRIFLRNKYKALISTVHDFIPEKFPQYFENPEFMIQSKKDTMSLSDVIICNSQCTYNDLEEFYPELLSKAKIINLGYDDFRLSVQQLPIKFPSPSYKILYVGKRTSYKNFIFLLNSLKTLKESGVKFSLNCFGGNDFSNLEQYTIKKFNLSDNVFKIPDSSDKMNVYLQSDLLIVTSIFEGFSLPVLEALSAGTDVLVSSVGNHLSMITDSDSLFDPFNENELIEKIRNKITLGSYDRKKNIIKYNKLLNHYSWEKSFFEHKVLYDGLL